MGYVKGQLTHPLIRPPARVMGGAGTAVCPPRSAATRLCECTREQRYGEWGSGIPPHPASNDTGGHSAAMGNGSSQPWAGRKKHQGAALGISRRGMDEVEGWMKRGISGVWPTSRKTVVEVGWLLATIKGTGGGGGQVQNNPEVSAINTIILHDSQSVGFADIKVRRLLLLLLSRFSHV